MPPVMEFSAETRKSRYLPDDLRYYSPDLDSNSRWVEMRDYGWVWTPMTAVAVDWAPYRTDDGSGSAVTMCGYLMNRGDGRRITRTVGPWSGCRLVPGPAKRGRCLLGAAYAGSVHTSTLIAWVPLAPGQIYHSRSYYGPQSMNVTDINITRTVVNVYKDVNINNSVTVANKQSFVNRYYKAFRIDQDQISNEKMSPGSPI